MKFKNLTYKEANKLGTLERAVRSHLHEHYPKVRAKHWPTHRSSLTIVKTNQIIALSLDNKDGKLFGLISDYKECLMDLVKRERAVKENAPYYRLLDMVAADDKTLSRWDVYNSRRILRDIVAEEKKYQGIQNKLESVIDMAIDSL